MTDTERLTGASAMALFDDASRGLYWVTMEYHPYGGNLVGNMRVEPCPHAPPNAVRIEPGGVLLDSRTAPRREFDSRLKEWLHGHPFRVPDFHMLCDAIATGKVSDTHVEDYARAMRSQSPDVVAVTSLEQARARAQRLVADFPSVDAWAERARHTTDREKSA